MGEISQNPTVDQDEISRFSALAKDWWAPKGPMAPLHAMNPVRLAYCRDRVAAGRAQNEASKDHHRKPFGGLKIADIGCGAGILSEPLSRLGAEVTAIDAAAENIEVARAHARENGCTVAYHCLGVEDLAASGRRFDVVCAMEIVEHVADLPLFLSACVEILEPGGDLLLSTINRTAKSFALAIIAAERVLRLLPNGTHEHGKFVKPAELRRYLGNTDAQLLNIQGLKYHLGSLDWRLSRDKAVNYLAHARRST